MPKGDLGTSVIQTSAAGLRDTLRTLEVGFTSIRGRKSGVMDLLKLRDQLTGAYAKLAESGMDLRAEMTRIQTLDNIIQRSAMLIDRELREEGGLAGARRLVQPPEENWWWYVDIGVAERRRKSAIRSISVAIVILVVLLGANYILDRFFGLSPIQKQARGYTAIGEQQLRQGNTEAAIVEFQKAAETLPEDGETHAMLVALYASVGRDANAAEELAAAEATFASRDRLLISLAQSYQSVGMIDDAMRAATQAVDLAPDSAQPLLVRGGIYETQLDVTNALADYEKAAELAQAQGDDTVYVLAKMRFGMLLERAPGLQPRESAN